MIHLCGTLTDQTLSSVDCFAKDVSSGPDRVHKTHGLSSKKGHGLDVSDCMDVWRHADEPLDRHLCTSDYRASDDGFVRSGVLRLAFAIEPFADERRSQRSVRSMGPSMSEENSAHGVLLASGHHPGFVDGMRVRFRSGEETRSHYDAVGAQAECGCETSCVGDTAGGQYERGCDRVHDTRQEHHGGNLTGHMSAGLDSLGNDHVHSCLLC